MRVVLAILLLLGATAALAYQYPMVPYSRSTGPELNGGRNGPMMPNSPGEAPPPPGDCSGAADFSDGCAVAIFH